MLNQAQHACISIFTANVPDQLKKGSIYWDIADTVRRHVIGKDAVESLFAKSIRVLVEQVASENGPEWVSHLENMPIERFSNCYLSKSPEIMMSIFENCHWQTPLTDKEATIIIRSNKLIVEVDSKTYISLIFENGSFAVPDWFPHLLRRLVADNVSIIDVQFRTDSNDLTPLHEYKKEMLEKIKNADFTCRGNHIYAPVGLRTNYVIIQGTLNFSAQHVDRCRTNAVFIKYSMRRGRTWRNLDTIIKNDFLPINLILPD